MNAFRGLAVVACVGLALAVLASNALAPIEVGTGGGNVASPRNGAGHSALSSFRAVTRELQAASPAKCAVKPSSEFAAYDPVNHYVYVSSLANYIVVLNSTVTGGTCNVKTNIKLPAGAGPEGLAFAPSDDQVYVADSNLNQVYVINGTKVVATITNITCLHSSFHCGFSEPFAVAYDPDDGQILVTNSGAANVTAIGTGPYNGLVYGIQTGGLIPDGIAYSAAGDVMIVTNWGSNDVSWFGAQYSQTPAVSSIPVGAEPIGVAADPFLAVYGYSYVTNYGSDNVTTIAPNGVLSSPNSIPVGSGPVSITFDQSNLRMYVANHFSDNVSVIGGAPGAVVRSIKLPNSSYLEGIVYDDENGDVYVVGTGNQDIYVLS
jgi:DNA-binding beta-propeller fold protein YncE